MKASVVIEGTPDEVVALIDSLRERGEVHVSFDTDTMVLLDWDVHPALRQLRIREREIMRLDLEHEPRRRIAELLDLTVGTVTVYRRSIRAKLRAFPPDQYPTFVREWLRRFPGNPALTSKPQHETILD